MKIAIYTSFAVNYLAKARVLVDTVKGLNPNIDVIAVVCDRIPPGVDISGHGFDHVWMVEDYPARDIKPWIFRHNIMELCTAVKGWGLTRLLEMGYDFVMYLDPDCWVLRDPAMIPALLPAEYSVGVVPHTTRAADSEEEIRIIETSSLRHGIYNLGFLLVRNDENGRRMAKWWADRLDQFCVDDFSQGMFTDQRWFDLATGYYDFILSMPHKGIDVASWNIGQRTLSRAADGLGYTIDGDDLIFYHFSGVGPTGVHRWVRDKFAPSDPLASELEFRYETMIRARGQAELERITPFFDAYRDGIKIPGPHRVFYRKRPDLQARLGDPFDAKTYLALQAESIHERNISSARPPEDEPSRSFLVRNDLEDVESFARRLFDSDYFRAFTANPESDPDLLWACYIRFGWDDDIPGNRYFDTRYYQRNVPKSERDQYPTPLHHYAAKGAATGLPPNWIYDDAYYLDRYADIRDAVRVGHVLCGFEHFVRFGTAEGRDGCAFFNERAYLDRNPDVAVGVARLTVRSGESHYVQYGVNELRALR